MLLRVRQVYETADIGVGVVSRESLATIPTFVALNDLNVGNCNAGATTPQQNQLFQNRNDVGQNEIVVYFILREDSTAGFGVTLKWNPARQAVRRKIIGSRNRYFNVVTPEDDGNNYYTVLATFK
jgi:hypothetical protein